MNIVKVATQQVIKTVFNKAIQEFTIMAEDTYYEVTTDDFTFHELNEPLLKLLSKRKYISTKDVKSILDNNITELTFHR